eukprot:TRINITY_DN47721_c0_g1_i1.p1 TRINITY_DN47721_c0_g1~~TRINITY_DN47721_c0_g1_i1.p1  ORF type:complete len:182 (+),score=17.91 TRINITY_DN47721_c0_g1_i1:67-612(+)
MPSWSYSLSKQTHGETVLGFYGSRTPMETPGPGAYDAYPFLNPTVHRTSVGRYFPDRAPGFRNVVDRPGVPNALGTPAAPWRPEPMSLSRLQSEQPLVHYASATFWAWPEQRRRSAAAMRHERQLMTDLTRKGSAGKGRYDYGPDSAWQSEDNTHVQMPRNAGMSAYSRSRSEGSLRASAY